MRAQPNDQLNSLVLVVVEGLVVDVDDDVGVGTVLVSDVELVEVLALELLRARNDEDGENLVNTFSQD